MHRNILVAAFAAVAIAACASNQQARDRTVARTQATEQAPAVGAQGAADAQAAQGVASPDEVRGRIATVDAQMHELAIDTGGATTQIRVKEDAQITVNGERASFEQLRQGVDVRAVLDRSGEVPMATRVEATSHKK